MQNILPRVLNRQHPDLTSGIYCACRLNQFSRVTGRRIMSLLQDIITTLVPPASGEHRLRAYVITEMLSSWRSWLHFSLKTLMVEAMEHFKHLDDSSMKYISTATQGFQIALALAKSTQDNTQQCEALFQLSDIKWHLGEYVGALVHVQEFRTLANTSGNLHGEARALSVEAFCWKALGHYPQCTSLINRAKSLLNLCGIISHGATSFTLMSAQVEVHKLKSEYADAHNILNLLVQDVVGNPPHVYASFLINMAEVEVYMDAPLSEVQKKIDVSRSIFTRVGDPRLVNACNYIQADLNLREGDTSSLLFCECLRAAWGRDWEIASFCLERLADSSCWQGAHHPFWSTVYLTHSLKSKEKLGIYKALQLIGDSFLEDNDQVTAISLFNLALEGFTSMDVHHRSTAGQNNA
ncbi:hypothetical protein C8F04DRAFT_1189275 [Mycena alexandri]|uniref:Uncharacterized protein n=1 Tax=Mycena alexandri TaxID=1745969 RepID=A0AAD6SKA3_9AGAR|nr:hypothetical protein C8F04DRAFT_1189275 [Mycena alexandri]